MWCMCLGVYLLRFITLGTKINKKYRNFSVLITEQVFPHRDAAVASLVVCISCNINVRIQIQCHHQQSCFPADGVAGMHFLLALDHRRLSDTSGIPH